jgi:tRNA 2-thiocytidine biosynthesis protein TtcA
MNWYLKKVQKKVGAAVKNFGLIEANDRIMVAISGGKDSMVLLHSLKTRSINFPFQIYIEAVFVNNLSVPYEVDTVYLKSVCDNLDIQFTVINSNVEIDTNTEKQPCFICSWNRRKALFSHAIEKDCNKVALGHHKDDIIQTLLMNMVFQGSISTMPPRLSIFDGKLEIIRPLASITEEECLKYAEIAGFKKEKQLCPYENVTRRKGIKEIIEKLQDLNPDVKNNIFNSMTNIQSEYLPGYNDQ